MKILDKNSVHLVIDIETTGLVETIATKGGCEILEAAVSVVYWSDFVERWVAVAPSGVIFPDQFKEAEESTVEWYHSSEANKKNMNDMAIARMHAKDAYHDDFKRLIEDIVERYETAHHCTNAHYWSRGKDFDFPILNAHAAQKGFEYPWMESFWNIHCLRDLEYFTGIKPEAENKHPHRAATDAFHEAKHLALILNKLEQL